jgi:hypothetical protein
VSDEAADSSPRQRSEPAGLVRMTEQPVPVPMPLTDAATPGDHPWNSWANQQVDHAATLPTTNHRRS